MLKTVNQKFCFIIGLLLLLFGILYAEIALFLNQLSATESRGQAVVLFDKEIQLLEKSFWELRYWEKVVLEEGSPNADQRFGQVIVRTKKKIKDLEPSLFGAHFQHKVRQIDRLLTLYEKSFSNIIQLKTEQHLNRTNCHSSYEALVSSILMSNEPGLIKLLFSLSRLQEVYFNLHRNSQQVALKVVLRSLKRKMAILRFDDRTQAHLNSYQSLLVRDFELEKKVHNVNNEFDNISQQIDILFSRISQEAMMLSQDEIRKIENLHGTLRSTFLCSVGLGAVMLFAIILIISKNIIKPLRNMTTVVANVKSGNVQARFESTSEDEIARLGFSINRMLDTIEENNRRLIASQAELEIKVQERTKEVETANKQLEKDIAARKQAEEALSQAYDELMNTQSRLIQSGKLASIGELVAGVAHELNQPLMVIRANAQLIQRSLLKNNSDTGTLMEQLEPIERNTKRMMNIINHLRSFSRESKTDFQPVNVNKIIEESFLMVNEQLRLHNIEVKKDLDSDLPEVKGETNQLEQVFLNLITNAQDAILQKSKVRGGESVVSSQKSEYRRSLEIISRMGELPNQQSTMNSRKSDRKPYRKSGDFIEILVRDNGGGIPPASLEKIFDPFFTTKEVGKGTGLGLSISYGIIKDHKGEIEVAKTGPEGTTFRIRLPGIKAA